MHNQEMLNRAARHMERLKESRGKKYTEWVEAENCYVMLAMEGSGRLAGAWRQARLARKVWMRHPGHLDPILELREPEPEPEPGPDTGQCPHGPGKPGRDTGQDPDNDMREGNQVEEGEQEEQRVDKPGKVRKLTEFFNSLDTPGNKPGPQAQKNTPGREKAKRGPNKPKEVSITKRKKPGNNKPNEATRKKLADSLRQFLTKKEIKAPVSILENSR